MAISSVLSSGLRGIQAGIGRVDQAGGRIAGANASTGIEDLTASIVNLRIGEMQVKVSADVVKVGDQILGTLLDTKA